MAQNINIKHYQGLSRVEKFAVWITNHIGTMGFFFIILIWTAFWLFWNISAPWELRFDIVPAFALWLFISNMIQLFLLPLIMIGQNLQGRHAELRAESDYEINLKSEKEIKEMKDELKICHGLLEEIKRQN